MSSSFQDGTSNSANASDLNAHANYADAREKLMNDMKNVITEAEDFLGNAAAHDSDKLNAVKEQFASTLQTAKTDLMKLEDTMLARTRLAAQATDTYVKDNPWKAVSVGAVVGMLFGLVISRR